MVTTKITTLHSIKCRISSNTFKNIHIQSLGTAVSQIEFASAFQQKGPQLAASTLQAARPVNALKARDRPSRGTELASSLWHGVQ